MGAVPTVACTVTVLVDLSGNSILTGMDTSFASRVRDSVTVPLESMWAVHSFGTSLSLMLNVASFGSSALPSTVGVMVAVSPGSTSFAGG